MISLPHARAYISSILEPTSVRSDTQYGNAHTEHSSLFVRLIFVLGMCAGALAMLYAIRGEADKEIAESTRLREVMRNPAQCSCGKQNRIVCVFKPVWKM